VDFWFRPADPVALSVLRVLGGLVFLAWLLPFAGEPEAWFGLRGWFDAQAYRETARLSELPPHLFGWSALYASADPLWVGSVYWVSITVMVLFTLGVATRVTGVLTWVAVVSFTANPATASDAEPLLQMLAFYLMLGHLLLGLRTSGQSWTARLLGPKELWQFRRFRTGAAAQLPVSVAANLAVRLFQVHFALAMMATGLHKLQAAEWWSGLAPWYYLHPPFHTTLADVQAYNPTDADGLLMAFSLASYLTLAWQIGFPAIAFRPSLRPVLLGGAVCGWVMTGLLLNMPIVGPLVMVACLSYVAPAGWRRFGGRLGRMLGIRKSLRQPLPETAPAPWRTKRGAKTAVAAVGNQS
jgi:hypothetical protein